MLWAIDVGNTNTVIGLYDGTAFVADFRIKTMHGATSDDLASTISPLVAGSGLDFETEGAILGSVVPELDISWRNFAERWLETPLQTISSPEDLGIQTLYEPPTGIGADRLANTLAAQERYGDPCIVVDFGTATTFDVLDARGRYAGGSILPGPEVALKALVSSTSKLPQIDLDQNTSAIGRNTVQAIRSGMLHGYSGAIQEIVARIKQELGEAECTVIATGGLAERYSVICPAIDRHDPSLTLYGLVLAYQRITS